MNFKTVSFKIHRIQIITSLPPSSNKLFVANITLNFWIKKSCDVNNSRFVNSSTVQSDHEQPITKSTNPLQLHCFSLCQNRSPQLPTVPIQRLPQCNLLLVFCEFENFAVTSDARKRIFTNFKHFVNSRIFTNFKGRSREFAIYVAK